MTRPRSRFGNQRRPANRRLGIIPGRRFALVLVLAGLSGWPGVAAAAGNASQLVSATVYQPGQAVSSDSVSVGALQADSCPTYSGPATDFQGPTGINLLPASTWSLASVLGCLTTPVPLTAVTQVLVQRDDGSFETAPDAVLSRADLTPPGDFPVAQEVPVISSDGSNLIYNRPKRNPGDDNLSDLVFDSAPAAFVIDVYEGPPLTVRVKASPSTVAVGGTVHFSASLSDPQPTGLTYNWNFGGGVTLNSSTSAAPSETFPAAGTYFITLQVGDAAGGGGTDRISLTVGSLAPAGSGTSPQPGTGLAPKSPSSQGPTAGSGQHVGGPAGKSNGNPSGTAKPTHGKTKAPAHPKTPAHRNTSSPSGQTGPRSPGAKRNGARTHRPSAATKPPAPGATFDPAHAPLVTGRLVSDVRLLAPASSPLVHAVPASVATAPAARRAIRGSLLPALAGASAALLLFALGAGRELWNPRRRRGWRPARAGG